MAETIIFNLASKALVKIGSLALQEVGLAWGVKDELKTLEDTFSTINVVLLNVERFYDQAPQDQEYLYWLIRLWFERFQAAFYEADNVLDEFHYEALRRKVQRMRMDQRRSIGIQKLVRIFFSSTHALDFRLKFKMGRKIEKIRKRLDLIVDNTTNFHPFITELRQTHHKEASTSVSSYVNESEFVGRYSDRERILVLLTTSSSAEEKICVIPIVGIAGLGKTALIKLLYNHEMVVGHFELRIWVKVARDFKVKCVMRKIIQSITNSPRVDFTSKQLPTVLAEKLQARRFLLVLDDVCKCDNRDWVKFFKFLTDGASIGSKIVVTTCCKLVASTVGTVPMYPLESLTDEDCHKLLLKWARREKVAGQYVNLLEIAEDIVKKCHGYPLAAKTLGNLLFTKTDENEWLYLKDKELWELVQNNKRDILPMLRFRYNPLPTDLKRCFIYCSIFPKNYEIEIDKLIQLWMAQGLIQSSSLNQELEDTGTDYFNQLCAIFFFEKIEQYGNLLNMCRMLEIIHDLAIFMDNKECSNTTNFRFEPISERITHLSLHDFDCLEKGGAMSLFKLKNLRTVFFPFQGVGGNNKDFVDRCISSFKYLHVVDMSNSSFQKLSHSIGNLKHLRFFDLSGNANIETLPNEICKLYNLQTLRIWNCVKIQELPKNIGNLISLRHLYLTTQQSCLPEKQIRHLTSLRSFWITGCENLTSLPEGMQLLVALRTITIAACPNLTCLPSSMKNLAKLENLEISNCPNLNLAGWEDFRGLRRLQ